MDIKDPKRIEFIAFVQKLIDNETIKYLKNKDTLRQSAPSLSGKLKILDREFIDMNDIHNYVKDASKLIKLNEAFNKLIYLQCNLFLYNGP